MSNSDLFNGKSDLICSDLRLFGLALRRSRDKDDKIINVLNGSLQRNENIEGRKTRCIQLYEDLRKESDDRVRIIRGCIGKSEDNPADETLISMSAAGTDVSKVDLREYLNKGLFFPNNERCVCVINVIDLTKKKRDERSIYLAAAIALETEAQPVIYILKQSEKTSEFKKKSAVWLHDVKLIDGRSDEPLRFDFENNKPHSIKCDNPIDKNNMLLALYKLSSHYLRKGPVPKFVNFKFPEDLSSLRDITALQEGIFEDNKNYQAITDDEQKRLLGLMSEWKFELRDSEAMMKEMVTKLVELDSANVNTIMRAEEDALEMMNKLDDAIIDLHRIEEKLMGFESRFELVVDAVKVMSDKDSLIQMEHSNRVRLEELLQLIIVSKVLNIDEASFPLNKKDAFDIPVNDLEKLNKAADTGFSDRSVHKSCLAIANKLLLACRVNFPDNIEDSLSAISDTKSKLAITCREFAQKIYSFLSKMIIKAAVNESNKLAEIEIDLPSHREMFAQLAQYSDLCLWLKLADLGQFTQLTKVYKISMAPIYDKEMCKFIELAQLTVVKDFGGRRSTAGISLENLFGGDRALSASSKSMESFLRLSKAKSTRQRASKVIDKVLSQIEDRVADQRNFLVSFFGINDELEKSGQKTFIDEYQLELKTKIDQLACASASSSSSDNQPVQTGSIGNSMETQSVEKSTKSSDRFTIGSSGAAAANADYEIASDLRLRSMMSGLFGTINGELQSLLFHTINADHFNCMYAFVQINEHNQKPSNLGGFFINKVIAALLIISKRALDRYTQEICNAILAFKITRNRVVGIMPFVDFFHEFVGECEEVFAGSVRRVDIDRVYHTIVDAIFRKIESALSVENVVVPGTLICIENYHRLQHVMRLLKVASLEPERRMADDRYVQHKASFVSTHFGKPFKGMFIFFEKIDQRLKSGIRVTDIQFQNDLSVAHLKRLIRDHPWTEVINGLDALHARIQLQISNNSSLVQVIWHDIQEFLLLQFHHYNALMRNCYPDSNVQLGFNEDDIVRYFSRSTEDNESQSRSNSIKKTADETDF